MTKALHLALVAALLLVAACTKPEPETYPLSGEQCAPDDPVQDISLPPCPPAT